MKARVFDTSGKETKQIDLPPVFETTFRPDVIRRAVQSSMSAARQPHGVDPDAGKRTTALNWGVGRGVARVPRVKGSQHPASGQAAFIGSAVGGAPTHPPRVRSYAEKINKKERTLAVRSAIAATADPILVESRGHIITDIPDIPLVVTDDFEQLATTADVVKAFSTLGLVATPKGVESEQPIGFGDIDKARRRMKITRAGKGKRRGRRHKNARSVLFVCSGGDQNLPIRMSARNLAGVDVVPIQLLNAEQLAPGTHPGRLTMWSLGALEQLSSQKLFEFKNE